jgi:4-hydroxy-tetrahydrodipicolinate synthase
MATSLTGIFTPNMTPLDSAGKINVSELRRYIDWLIEFGVQGTISQRIHRRIHAIHSP